MAWLIDPRMWDDKWWSSLSPMARLVWLTCLVGPPRTSLPGLVRDTSIVTIADRLRYSVEDVTAGLFEALKPDSDGITHMLFDPSVRVVQIPQAPKYNRADNPNVLTAWFLRWLEVPNCALKDDHVACVASGVNLKNPNMAQRWAETFGKLEFNADGSRVDTYSALYGRGNGSSNRSGPSLPHSPSGSEEEIEDGSGNRRLPEPLQTTNRSLNGSKRPEPQTNSEHKHTQSGGQRGRGDKERGRRAESGHGTVGVDTAGAGSGTGAVASGDTGGGKSRGMAPENGATRRRNLPPGID